MSKKLLATPYLIWMAGFIIIPLLLIVYYGMTDASGSFTVANIVAILEPERFHALLRSLWLSALSTFICFILAYPLAMILKRLGGNYGKGLMVFIFILPMWMNFLLRTMAWQVLLDRNGLINQCLHFFGLPSLNLINTSGAIIFGMVYNFLPFMVLPLYNTLLKISDDVLEASYDLGATKVQTFRKVIFPLSIPGIISGITMVFVPSLTTFVLSNLLGGGMILLIGNVIEQEFTYTTNWNLGSGLSLVLMIFILISMALIAKYDKEGAGTTF
ncbi:Spermidine Putrescine ABC transporter permease component PotB [Lachnospiraceae bacterium TWA4]|nr:Spermidine Putrescine ABC transporter permease component PotB [Lachnospiraceae bacterium TWA4]